MPKFIASQFDPRKFAGKVRLFPLPNLVLFPRVLQPLHIFEHRYRDLMAEAVATDGFIAMAVLSPGWQNDYEGRPPIFPFACLGQIVSYERLADGRYNLLLEGVSRLRIVRELSPKKSFREAQAELVEDILPADQHRGRLRQELVRLIKKILGPSTKLPDLEPLLSEQAPLGLLTDLLGYAADLPVATKVELLSQRDVEARAAILLEHFAKGLAGAAIHFPPDFSVN
jgi:Lon protease-like protein